MNMIEKFLSSSPGRMHDHCLYRWDVVMCLNGVNTVFEIDVDVGLRLCCLPSDVKSVSV